MPLAVLPLVVPLRETLLQKVCADPEALNAPVPVFTVPVIVTVPSRVQVPLSVRFPMPSWTTLSVQFSPNGAIENDQTPVMSKPAWERPP